MGLVNRETGKPERLKLSTTTQLRFPDPTAPRHPRGKPGIPVSPGIQNRRSARETSKVLNWLEKVARFPRFPEFPTLTGRSHARAIHRCGGLRVGAFTWTSARPCGSTKVACPEQKPSVWPLRTRSP